MAYKSKNYGFTLVELILFLALTGLFLLIALNGVSGRSGKVQFTDSMRSLESVMRKQAEEILTGVNPIGGGDNEGQIILGFVVEFNDNSGGVNVYKIRGSRLSTWSGNIQNDIYDSLNTLNGSGTSIIYNQTSYTLEWGSQFAYGQNLMDGQYSPPNSTHRIGLIRDPNGIRLIPFAILDSAYGGTLDNPSLYNSPSVSAHVCIKGGNGQTGELTMASGRADYNFEVGFDPDELPCSMF